jgi:chorismate mutase
MGVTPSTPARKHNQRAGFWRQLLGDNMQANYMLAKDPLSLDRIRSILTRLEDTIIFSLIERAQFAHNPKIYERGVFKELEALQFKGSWLEWFLKETEAFHGAFTRYQTHFYSLLLDP